MIKDYREVTHLNEMSTTPAATDMIPIVDVSGVETKKIAPATLFGGATSAEVSNVADVSARVQELTASGSVTSGIQSVELNHATVIAATTIADFANHEGLFIVKNTSASGTAAHTLTLTSGTFNGTNNVATLNAPNEALVVYVDSAGDGTIIENVGTVALS